MSVHVMVSMGRLSVHFVCFVVSVCFPHDKMSVHVMVSMGRLAVHFVCFVVSVCFPHDKMSVHVMVSMGRLAVHFVCFVVSVCFPHDKMSVHVMVSMGRLAGRWSVRRVQNFNTEILFPGTIKVFAPWGTITFDGRFLLLVLVWFCPWTHHSGDMYHVGAGRLKCIM